MSLNLAGCAAADGASSGKFLQYAVRCISRDGSAEEGSSSPCFRAIDVKNDNEDHGRTLTNTG
jgi:hypothetical protein